jgi:hypothetical protein
MKLKNHLNESFSIDVTRYKIPESNGVLYTSDWLLADLAIRTEDLNFKRELEFLTIGELERLMHWLKSILKRTAYSKKLEFVDPSIYFRLVKRGGNLFIKLVDLQEDQSLVSLDLEANERNLKDWISQLKKILNEFPCRCGQPHDLS